MSTAIQTCPPWCVTDDHHGYFPEEPAQHSSKPWTAGADGAGEARITLEKVDGDTAHIDLDASVSLTADEARQIARALVAAAAQLEDSQ